MSGIGADTDIMATHIHAHATAYLHLPLTIPAPAPVPVPPPDVAADPLSHPLFSSGLSAALSLSGPYRHAFNGIAAIIDEEHTQQEEEEDNDEDGHAHSRPHRSNSAPITSGDPFTWTRPSAIRVARMKAEATERAKRGEQTHARSQHRATPYGRPRSSRSVRTSPSRPAGECDHQSDRHSGSCSPSPPTDNQTSHFGAIRSHARRRGKAPSTSSSSSSIAARMTIRTPSELAADRAAAAQEAVSAGETTMLMHMWKM